MRDAPSTPPIPSPVPLDALGFGAAALRYARQGRAVFPCLRAAKEPATAHGCKDATTDEKRIRAWWRSEPRYNVGLATGEPSGVWVLDIDGEAGLASLRALEEEHGELPTTLTCETGGGGYHFYWRTTEGLKNRAGVRPGIDVRAAGGYAVVPPSVHPSGAVYRWLDDDAEVAEAPAWLLDLVVKKPRPKPALAVLEQARARPELPQREVVKHPVAYARRAIEGACAEVAEAPEGTRNDVLNKQAFALARTLAGLRAAGESIDMEQACDALARAALDAGLEEGEVQATLRSGREAGERDPRHLEVVRPEAPARRGRPRAEDVPRPEGEDDRPVIMVDRADLGGMIDAAERALLAAGTVFVGAGHRLVRLHRGRPTDAGIRHASDAPIIAAVDADWLRTELAARARFVATSADGKARDCYPPREVIAGVLARGGWPFPALDALADGPVLRPDGTAATRSGYDAGARVWIEATGEPVTVPERASHEDARRAARRLLEPFAEFPFLGAEDRAVALAAVLTIVARPAIDGPCPLFAVSATSPASGKGLLAAIVSRIATGREPAVMSQGRDPDETRKRVLALALDGAPLVLVDNVVGTLGDGPMAAALTGGAVVDRVLGETRMVRAPMRAVWFATGNNLAFSADVGRRVLLARLDPGCAHPEDRVFREPDVLGTVMRRRGELLSAALVVLLAFVQAGRPKHRGGSRMGSFEAWDDLVRSCLLWLDLDELGDPCGTRSAVRADADRDLEALRALVLAWHENLGPQRARTMRAVVDHAAQHRGHSPELEDALLAIDPAATDRLTPKSLGIALRVHLGRWVVTEPGRAMRLVLAGQTRDGVNEYRLDVDDRRHA